eukprot:TRINITY_DN44978_c0_g1_i1.p1 TRINITY_DN44978_c0_g1~~TRINITY_DN44978_c0_g1_i1.p1  ORF type:complete len:388 (-),score=87.29 TRINITY_DN44978_c0_g1_i1:225-1388(-)
MADEGGAPPAADAADAGGAEESTGKSMGTKDLWQIILSKEKSTSSEQQDINIVVLGNKHVGKSTIIQRFAKKDDTSTPKPTAALEYSHLKREDRGQVKMAHFWELGGGTQLSSLLDVVITDQNIHTVVVVLVLDLKEGRHVWASLQHWMLSVKKRVSECFRKLKSRGSSTPGKMISRMQKRFGDKHPDIEKVHIHAVPTILLCTKHDLFRDQPSEEQKVMARTLRYWAHSYAAALMYLSTKDERDVQRFRQLMLHLIFGIPWSGQIETDHSKSLLILPGKDSFKEIGPAPQAPRQAGFQTCGNEDFDKWKAAFETIFPAVKDKDKGETYDIANPEYAEPQVDTMRAVKDDELEQYRLRRRKAMEDALRKEARAKAAEKAAAAEAAAS